MTILVSSPAANAVHLGEKTKFEKSVLEPRIHASTLQGVANDLKWAPCEEKDVSSPTLHRTKEKSDKLEKDDEEKDGPESSADSDSGDDTLLRPLHITERRRAQNARFSAW